MRFNDLFGNNTIDMQDREARVLPKLSGVSKLEAYVNYLDAPAIHVYLDSTLSHSDVFEQLKQHYDIINRSNEDGRIDIELDY